MFISNQIILSAVYTEKKLKSAFQVTWNMAVNFWGGTFTIRHYGYTVIENPKVSYDMAEKNNCSSGLTEGVLYFSDGREYNFIRQLLTLCEIIISFFYCVII